jgi:quercetin dioxygenase-like cupin family protein
MSRALIVTVAPLIILFGLLCPAAQADQSPPKDNKGFSTVRTVTVDLGSEIDGMNGRQLRMRELRIEPGGHIGIHSHKDRPAVVYFLQGTDTVTFEDGSKKTFHAGDMTSATKNTTHWHENTGAEPVILIGVDVFHQQKSAAAGR